MGFGLTVCVWETICFQVPNGSRLSTTTITAAVVFPSGIMNEA